MIKVVADLEAEGLENIPERLFHVAETNGESLNITDIWSFEGF